MSFHELDLMARGAALSFLCLWSAILLRDHRQELAARIAVMLNAAIACHIIASMSGSLHTETVLGGLLDTGSSAVIGLFWLYVRVWFDDLKRIGWPVWAVVFFPPTVVAIIDFSGLSENSWFHVWIWFPFLRAIWFLFILNALWIAWRGRDDDLVESRRRIRLQTVAATGILALAVNLIEIAVFRFGAAVEWRSVPEIGIALITLFLSASMFAHRQPDHFGPPKREGADTPTLTADDPLAQRLLTHMETALPHRDEGLTIAALANQLGEQEYKLRRLINGGLGHRNFAQFLNGYRLAEVKAALTDPSQNEVPILTMALDAGFGSLGPFNRAFRDAEGMTPSEYRRRFG